MSISHWISAFAAWMSLREPAPEPERTYPIIRVEPTVRGIKIRPEAVARATVNRAPLQLYTTRQRSTNDGKMFAPAKPMPGVVPDDAKPLAMDDAFAGQVYSSYGGDGYGEGLQWLGFPYLAELTQRAEYRRIVETMAREMTRRWIKVQATGGDDKTDKVRQIEADLGKYKIQQKFRRLAELDGYFGRAHLYIDTGVPMDDRTLLCVPIIQDSRTFEKGMLKDLRVVEPTWTYPGNYNARDPLARDYYLPTTWYVQQREVHRTRLLTFVSREVPDILKPAYSFGGLSMSQMAKPYVDNWLRTRQSVSDLIHSFSVMVLATDMSSVLQDGGGDQENLRAAMFNAYRDNRGLFMINKATEEVTNITTSLGTLDHLQAQSQEHMASVSGLPLIVLTGITPSGLNASSEGELQTFAQTVRAAQEHLFADHLRTIINLIQLDRFGEVDPEITFDFNPLKEESSEEEANRRKADAETDATYVNAGVLGADEIREKIAADEDSPYAGLDLSGPAPTPPAAEPDPMAEGDDTPPGTPEQKVATAAAGDTVDEIAKHVGGKTAQDADIGDYEAHEDWLRGLSEIEQAELLMRIATMRSDDPPDTDGQIADPDIDE